MEFAKAIKGIASNASEDELRLAIATLVAALRKQYGARVVVEEPEGPVRMADIGGDLNRARLELRTAIADGSRAYAEIEGKRAHLAALEKSHAMVP